MKEKVVRASSWKRRQRGIWSITLPVKITGFGLHYIVNVNFSSSNRGVCAALMYLLELCGNTVNVMIKYNCINTRKKRQVFFFQIDKCFPILLLETKEHYLLPLRSKYLLC